MSSFATALLESDSEDEEFIPDAHADDDGALPEFLARRPKPNQTPVDSDLDEGPSSKRTKVEDTIATEADEKE